MSATEIAAWWGAATATLVLLWDVFKWWRASAVNLRVSAGPNMRTFDVDGCSPDQLYISVQVTNIGDKTTTITHLVGSYYSRFWQVLFRKPNQLYLMPKPSPGALPHPLEPGAQWHGLCKQTEEVESKSRGGRFYVGVFHSLSGKPRMVRLVVPGPEGQSE